MFGKLFLTKKLAWAFALLALVSSTAFAGKPTKESLDAVDAYVQSLMKEGGYPGLSVSIYYDGEPVLEKGYGYANLEWQQQVTPDTVFEIGSISKTFTALSIMQLAEAGKLSLDDTVAQHVSDLPEEIGKLPLRRLLNHTSGLGNYTNVPEIMQVSVNHALTLDGAFDFIAANTPILFQAGDEWSYSNSGTWLLSYIVEKVSGQSFADYLQANIFQPFGMTKSQLNDYNQVIERRAAGYNKAENGFTVAPQTVPVIPYGAGSIISTTQDLQRYMQVLHASDKISDNIRQAMLRHEAMNDGREIFYTTGCLMAGDFYGHQKYEHGGGISGFNSQHAYYPSDDLGIVVLTNTVNMAKSVGAVERDIAKMLFEVESLPAGEEISDSEYSRYLGEYRLTERHADFGNFTIQSGEAGLTLKLGGTMYAQMPEAPVKQLDEHRVIADMGRIALVLSFSDNGSADTVVIGDMTYKVDRVEKS